MYKIAIIGPESTGKTMLTEQLADHYHSPWVPEYARTYIESLSRSYHFDDIKYAKCMEIERVNGSDLLLLKYLYPVSKNKWHSEAVVLDLSTRKICIISVPDEYSVSTFKQHNDCLMLSIYKPEDDIIIQTAYFIPISGIELVDSD